MPRLDFYANFKLLVKVRLRNQHILIGRATDCDIQLPDDLVSRHHAKLEEREGGSYWIENLSPNGTRVNHSLVSTPQELRPGDRIYIEKSVVIYQPDDAPSAELEQRATQLRNPVIKLPIDKGESG